MSARDKYKDIIDLPHFVSKNRKHMSNLDRAAQFAPFAALVGYEESINETGRITEDRIELSETNLAILDKKINILKEHLKENIEISITYFVPDELKSGGSYKTDKIIVKSIDEINRLLIDINNKSYPLDYLIDISGDVIDRYYI